MSATVVGLVASCPLCGESLGSAVSGRAAEPHAVLFRTHGSGEGILLCDDCATLAELPTTITLN